MSSLLYVVLCAIASLCMATPTKDQSFDLRLVHTNDMHSRFEQTSKLSGRCSDKEAEANQCYGGFGRVLTAVKAQRKKASDDKVPLLFLNAGDTYQGTIWYTVYKWRIVAIFLNLLGIDAMSLGNHEFDDGVAGLAPFLHNVSVPVVTCNLGLEKEPDLAQTPLQPSIIIDVEGRKIGIVGYLTPETKAISQTQQVEIYDEVESLTKEVKKLKDQRIDIIIAVGHSGYDTDLKIAKNVPEVDVVVGGHTNTFLYTGTAPDSEVPADVYPVIVTQESGRKVAVVQAYAYTKYLGVLHLSFDEQGELTEATGNPILLDHQVEQDPEVLAVLERFRPGIENISKEEIGRTRVFLDGNTCRFYECNLGNLITDAFIDYAVRTSGGANWTNAPIALLQGGGVRSSIDIPSDANVGIITREDMMIALPFYNTLKVIRIKGKYLLDALEWSVTRYDPQHVIGRGEFLQVAGLRIVHDLTKPIGSRVISAKARCSDCNVPEHKPIEPETEYNIIMTRFLAEGGDNYTMFSTQGSLVVELDEMDTDVAIDFIKSKGVLYAGLEDRINFSTKECTNDNHKGASSVFLPKKWLLVTLFVSCFLKIIYI